MRNREQLEIFIKWNAGEVWLTSERNANQSCSDCISCFTFYCEKLALEVLLLYITDQQSFANQPVPFCFKLQ